LIENDVHGQLRAGLWQQECCEKHCKPKLHSTTLISG
jgi:hypothetical protein